MILSPILCWLWRITDPKSQAPIDLKLRIREFCIGKKNQLIGA
jgi:hypothetical protein